MRSDLLDVPRFFPTDIARAVGIEDRTLAAWIGRNSVPLSPHDRGAAGSGSRRLLTLRTAYHIAVASTLVKQGLPPAFAFRNSGGMIESLEQAHAQTAPEHRSENNRELLLIWPADPLESAAKSGHSYVEIDTRITVMIASPTTDFWKTVFANGETVVTVVDLGKVLKDMDKALGI